MATNTTSVQSFNSSRICAVSTPQHLHTAKEQQKRDKEAEKVMNQQLRDANKAYKLKIHQEKLEARRVAKVEREQRKAEEVAERQRKKETQEANRNAQKALQLPQTGKRKA
ncbi:hypothetical protein EJ07DRAFT_176540 [Lizonia empirigonia]|nr:hypothetical protein EJ07DRAFT_176540 [Lizonia empirigonia]